MEKLEPSPATFEKKIGFVGKKCLYLSKCGIGEKLRYCTEVHYLSLKFLNETQP